VVGEGGTKLDQYILSPEGEPVPEPDTLKWAAWSGLPKRGLARDTFGEGKEGISVSTVFLALDHGYPPGGPPVLWETMVFGGKWDGLQWRHTSKEAALKGHKKAVAKVKRSLARVDKGFASKVKASMHFASLTGRDASGYVGSLYGFATVKVGTALTTVKAGDIVEVKLEGPEKTLDDDLPF
jgi:hypothetical protein